MIPCFILFILSPSIPLGWYLHMDRTGSSVDGSRAAVRACQSTKGWRRSNPRNPSPYSHGFICNRTDSLFKTVTLIRENIFSRQRRESLFRSVFLHWFYAEKKSDNKRLNRTEYYGLRKKLFSLCWRSCYLKKLTVPNLYDFLVLWKTQKMNYYILREELTKINAVIQWKSWHWP